MKNLLLATLLFSQWTLSWGKESSSESSQRVQEIENQISQAYPSDSLVIYQTENLIIKRISDHVYVHISFLNTDDFGKVASNGMLVISENEGIIFDTPTDNTGSLELMNFVNNELESEIIAIIPTHFHQDCIGGIQKFEERNIPIYATHQTLEILKNEDQNSPKSIKGFDSSLILTVGSKKIHAEYFGEGHTADNIIGYFPEGNTIFGGCLIKTMGAGKGYLGNANVNEWSETVRKIKLKYPNIKRVIPGHGEWGGKELLDYTIHLFE